MKNKKMNDALIVLAGLIVLTGIGITKDGSGTAGLSASSENLTGQYRTFSNTKTSGRPAEEFLSSYADFSVRMLQESRSPGGGNTMISPLSIMMALAMTENGAKGETLLEMQAVLAPAMEQAELNANLNSWADRLPDSEQAHFNMANSIWLNRQEGKFIPNEEFLRTNALYFNADIYTAPFDGSTLSDINRWAEKYTEGMVKEALDEITPEAVMYLVNAMAFEAEWEAVYESAQVQEAVFTCADGSEEEVPMMYSDETVYLKDEHASGFLKPYASGYSFAALLPEKGMSLDAYIGQLEGETFLDTIQNKSDTMVIAGLPKFETETSLELSGPLCTMGMPLAFHSVQADFSGIGTGGSGNIYISRVIHKTYIKVDERGTKAGAVTVVAMESGSAMTETETETVILNRPFLYAIIENDTNLPVFIGTVEDF